MAPSFRETSQYKLGTNPTDELITSGFPVTRAKLVKALMLPCSSMLDSTMGAIILA